MLMNNFLSNDSIKLRLSARSHLGIGLLLVLLLLSVATFAQKITLNYQHAPLEQVLREIRKQSGYDIFFDQNLVNQQPPVAVKISNANVEEAMSSALKGLQLSFAINGRTISIKKPDKAVAATGKQQKITITGTVIDDNGLPLAGVSVSSATLKPVYTDGEGKFTLKDIDPLAVVHIAYTGKITVERTALSISLMAETLLETGSIDLDQTIIQGQRMAGKAPGTFKLDISHRKQQSVVQALEGTVPGLVIKSQRTTTTQLIYTSDGFGVPAGRYTREQLYNAAKAALGAYLDEAGLQNYVNSLINQGYSNGKTTSITTITNNGVIPELRGAGGFGAGNNAMLIVIDGFIQDSFPADYPMANVLSLEVIRDPAETIKWGPRAGNGVIIITTNGGQPGKLQMNYTSTFNFSGAPDNSAKALQRASTTQILDYEMEAYKFFPIAGAGRPDLVYGTSSVSQILLEKRRAGLITEAEFQSRWNLLSQLSNEDQYREQQRGIFSQNQNLNLSGGNKYHRFSLNGNYNTSHTEALENSNRIWGLNLREQVSLLKNKLQIGLQVNSSLNKGIAGTMLDPAELQPYQMLYKADGSYVYDYTKLFNQDAYTNLKTSYPGLQNYGYNPLEEARGTRMSNKGHDLNTSLNVNWKLLDGLTWSTNLQYTDKKNNGENLRQANTYAARELYNNYYAVSSIKEAYFPGSGIFVPTPLTPPVAYLPLGDIFQASQSTSNSTNLRTGITYNKVFNQKHALNVGLGFSAFKQLSRSSSDLPLYGYNSNTGLGTNLSLPNSNQILSNVLGAINFSPLIAPIPINRKPERNMSTNASLDYTYDGRLGLQAFYNESYMPISSADVYSSTRNYNAMASWALHKESFFKFPLISKLKLSAGFGEIKMASLPVNLPAVRVFQPNWGTTSLVVNGYNPIRQNGERIRNYDALLDLGMFKDVLQGQLNYRYNSMGVKNQVSGRISYHISKANYFNVPWVSNLMIEGFVSNISPAQALAQMMSTNSPLTGGGFSAATGNFDLGSLPEHIKNREISLRFGLWKDRLTVDSRYYNRSSSGMSNGTFQSDLSTGFAQRSLYSRMDNKGFELYLQGKIFQGDGFTWNSIINAAYNLNQAKDVLKPIYDPTTNYLMANRNGYALGSLWSFRWAGLDNKGNPQVFDPNGNKVSILSNQSTGISPLTNANENWIEYSGRTTAPWSGALIQEFGYKGFYARASLRFALGHVMRTYRPIMQAGSDKSSLIENRWRQPGDEAKTDIPGIIFLDAARTFAAQNSSNSIAPADFFRLNEIQLGYDVPAKWLTGKYVKSLNLALNLQNVALWTRNKLGIDPEAIMSNGKLLPRQPLRYGLALFVGL